MKKAVCSLNFRITGRLALNNQKRDTAHVAHDVSGRDSLDIEVAQKVAMTLAALCGTYSFGVRKIFLESYDR